jgi:hypothetical protein
MQCSDAIKICGPISTNVKKKVEACDDSSIV